MCVYMEIYNYKIKGCQNVAHKKSVKLYCKLVKSSHIKNSLTYLFLKMATEFSHIF